MVGILYLSESTGIFDDQALRELGLHAAVANKRRDITGYLFYRGGLFLQYIEGHFQTTQNLMNRIRKDRRHNVINIIERDGLTNRLFPDWHMQVLSFNHLKVVRLESIVMESMSELTKMQIPSDNENTIEKVNQIWSMVDLLSNKSASISA